jgi:hypothetical protein
MKKMAVAIALAAICLLWKSPASTQSNVVPKEYHGHWKWGTIYMDVTANSIHIDYGTELGCKVISFQNGIIKYHCIETTPPLPRFGVRTTRGSGEGDVEAVWQLWWVKGLGADVLVTVRTNDPTNITVWERMKSVRR